LAERGSGRLLNVPNTLTALRIALIGVYLWLFWSGRLWPAAAVFALAASTDAVDGALARKLGQVTWLGKVMDPVADKLMVAAALVTLAMKGWAPWWLIIAVAVKDGLMMLGGLVLLRMGIVPSANWGGKAATGVFLAAIAAGFFHEWTAPVDLWLQWAAFAISMLALVGYAVWTVRALQNRKKGGASGIDSKDGLMV
jgi:CDP-diacylglycerol--glycerol-3-phosphate 3-phosphatidyltransferase